MTEQKIAKNDKKTNVAATTSDYVSKSTQGRVLFDQGGILIKLYLLRCVQLATSSEVHF